MAAIWAGLKFTEFLEMEGDEMSRIVAAYETSMQVEAARAHDLSKPRPQKKRS